MYQIFSQKVRKLIGFLADYSKKHKKTSYTVAVLIVLFILYSLFSSNSSSEEEFTVKTGPLSQEVKVTGQVESSNDASLAFQTLGQVAYVGVKIGDSVPQGKVLATLSAGDAQANLLQAQANLQNAEVILDQLLEGARPEEIAIKQQLADNAKTFLDQTYLTIPDAIRNVDSTTADIVKNKLASIFTFNGNSYNLSFSSCSQGLQSVIEEARTKLDISLSNFQNKSSTITALSSQGDIDKVFEDAYIQTVATNDLVAKISSLLLLSCSVQNSSLDTARTNISTSRTSMNTLFSDISTKRNSLTTAKNNYSQAKRDLDLIKAGTDPYVIRSKRALVTQAEAQVAQAQAGLSKTIVFAPFAGIISDINIEKGETVSSGATVIKMIATKSFEVEAKVPEIDIVKIKLGGKVNITLDAYGKDIVFPAVVTRVDPTSTTEGTVPVYKVVVTFINPDQRLKSGMTANVNIITEELTSVIAIPSRFVKITDGGKGVVLVKDKESTIEREVTLGIRGSAGLIEIKSGLLEGEVILSPSTIIRSAQKQTQ